MLACVALKDINATIMCKPDASLKQLLDPGLLLKILFFLLKVQYSVKNTLGNQLTQF